MKPPPNLELERAVLAGLMLDPNVLEELQLAREDFGDASHRLIFKALTAVHPDVDVRTLEAWLEQRGHLAKVGGLGYLAGLDMSLPDLLRVPLYAGILRELRVRREVAERAHRLAYIAEEPGEITARDLLDHAGADLVATEKLLATGEAGLEGMGVTTHDLERELQERNGTALLGLSTGFRALDAILQGLEPGKLYILAARTGMGKSALADDILLSVAVHQKKRAALFTLEMTKRERAERMVSKLTEIEYTRIRQGYLTDSNRARISVALSTLRAAPLLVNDSPGLTLAAIAAELRRARREGPLGLAVVDYLGLMSFAGLDGDNLDQRLGQISGGMAKLARELDIPIIALHQLNREPEKRVGGRPQLSDLRGSGNLEQDANAVLFIYREEVYTQKPEHRGAAEIIVAKNRAGATDIAHIRWAGDYVRFENRRGE